VPSASPGSPGSLAILLATRGIHDARVLEAFRKVPRAHFCPEESLHLAYEDEVVPLAEGSTLSQPFVVAAMLEALALRGGERALDVGSGSGFTTALLAQLAKEVCGIESDPELLCASEERLQSLGLRNFALRCADGWRGWPELGPYDAILVSAAVPEPPPDLLAQLAPGGRIVMPIGGASEQMLEAWWRDPGAGPVLSRRLFPVRFVPLVPEGWTPD